MLKANQTLQKLHLGRIHANNNKYLGRSNISNDGLKIICTGLEENISITNLTLGKLLSIIILGWNPIDDKGINYIYASMKIRENHNLTLNLCII